MSQELSKQFSDCLLWLASGAQASFKDTHHSLITGMNPVGDQVLERVLESDPDPMLDTRGLVVLPPVGPRVPLLQLSRGTEHDQDILRMTLVVVGEDAEGPHAMAWRFEAPRVQGSIATGIASRYANSEGRSHRRSNACPTGTSTTCQPFRWRRATPMSSWSRSLSPCTVIER